MIANDVPVVFSSWNDVETALGTLAKARAEQNRINDLYEAKVTELNAQKDQELNQVDAQVQLYESTITGFVRNHLDDFKEYKHMSFNTGKIAVKEVKGYEYPKNKELVALLHHLGMENLIEVEETPSKSAIRLAAKNDPDLYKKLEIEVEDKVSITIETF